MKSNPSVKRNISLLWVYNILIKRVTMPIIVLYYLLNNLSFIQIGILASILAIFTLLFEVPSGIFADKYGRKKALLISTFTGALSALFYYLGNDFWMFSIATALFGISAAFTSGTIDAILYDTLIVLKKRELFKKHRSRQFLYANLINGVILLFIPFIYEINEKLPFLIGVLFFTTALFVSFFFIEPPIKKKLGREFLEVFLDSGKEIKLSRNLFLIILTSSLTLSFIYATSEYYQPLLNIVKFPIILFGVIYFVKRLILGVGAQLSHMLEKWIKTKTLIIVLGILILLSYLGSSTNIGFIVIISIILFSFVEGAHKVIFKDEINKRVSSDNRSTILSFEEFIQNLSKAGIALVYGYFADLIGIQQMLLLGGILFFLVFTTLISLIFIKKVFKN
ncbi:MAG: MFS transporter [Candidatus Nanoarchaeia archaeon]